MENSNGELCGQGFRSVRHKEPVVAAQFEKNRLFTVYKLRQVQGMTGSTVTRKVRLCETAP